MASEGSRRSSAMCLQETWLDSSEPKDANEDQAKSRTLRPAKDVNYAEIDSQNSQEDSEHYQNIADESSRRARKRQRFVHLQNSLFKIGF